MRVGMAKTDRATRRRWPKNDSRNKNTGIINQPKEYRVKPPNPTNNPVSPASPNKAFSLRVFSRAPCSNNTRHQTTPTKISTSNIVESPDVLKRQNNSVPRNTVAESQATVASNKRRVRKNTSTPETKNKA